MTICYVVILQLLIVQVMVCRQGGSISHVFESELRLPKFCMYAPADLEALPPSTCTVTFDIAERPARSASNIHMHYIHCVHLHFSSLHSSRCYGAFQ